MEILLSAILLLLLLCGVVGGIMLVLNHLGWVERLRPTVIITTGLLILIPVSSILYGNFQTQACLQNGGSEYYPPCNGGLAGALFLGIRIIMIALSFVVGPLLGKRLYKSWTIETE